MPSESALHSKDYFTPALSPSPCSVMTLEAMAEDSVSLWFELRQQLYKSEVSHMKRLVGEGLIRQNATLREELSSLRQMLSAIRQEIEGLAASLMQQDGFLRSKHRDLLERQIQLMLDNLRDRVEACGGSLDDLLPELRTPKFQAYRQSGLKSRTGTCRITEEMSKGLAPSTPSTRRSSAASSRCSTPDLAGSLSGAPLVVGRALGVDELVYVSSIIREALLEEQAALQLAVGQVVDQLEAEAQHRGVVGRKLRMDDELSTAELQQFTHRIQELAQSPTLKTLGIMKATSSPHSVTGPEGVDLDELPPAPLPPLPGAASINRLRALIAQRRSEAAPHTPSLNAVPEVSDSNIRQPLSATGGYNALCPPSAPFDPFFDDPFA
eukprot:TRINITY_DN6623_c0_g1_i1.p1 TRINITY_DN6623_c0_g1~~TRINITY_DN6623_c0_g1_i1.p1  ORF type:complete len:407 (+),score=54.45 TRINITY_DN6623_c0_g1_i1:81-1223(+)